MNFAFEIDSGFKMYLWDGNFRDQPYWFIDLLGVAQNQIVATRKEIMDKKHGREKA
jgi:hypothetical protein